MIPVMEYQRGFDERKVECITCGDEITMAEAVACLGQRANSCVSEMLYWCPTCWKERYLHPSERTKKRKGSIKINKVVMV